MLQKVTGWSTVDQLTFDRRLDKLCLWALGVIVACGVFSFGYAVAMLLDTMFDI